MRRSPPALRLMAIALAGLAGYVDAIGFIELGGSFVSFMSGNSTQFAVGLAGATAPNWAAGGLVGLFVAGVVSGTALRRASGRHAGAAVVALVSLLLAVAAAIAADAKAAAIAAMTLAMGAENAVFEEGGEVRIGLTYMTGTLVKVGQGLVTVATGGPRDALLPHLALWLALVVGAGLGALAHGAFGFGALWFAAGAAVAAAAVALGLEGAPAA